MTHYPYAAVLLNQHGYPYTYKNHVPDLGAGDYVVVVLPTGQYGLGKVKDLLTDDLQGKATKWIVDKVTFDADKYNALTAIDPPPEPKPRIVQSVSSQILAPVWVAPPAKPKKGKKP